MQATSHAGRAGSEAVIAAMPRAIWRTNQMQVAPTGFHTLDRELPGGGWPSGSLIELLALQASPPCVIEFIVM